MGSGVGRAVDMHVRGRQERLCRGAHDPCLERAICPFRLASTEEGKGCGQRGPGFSRGCVLVAPMAIQMWKVRVVKAARSCTKMERATTKASRGKAGDRAGANWAAAPLQQATGHPVQVSYCSTFAAQNMANKRIAGAKRTGTWRTRKEGQDPPGAGQKQAMARWLVE